MTPKWILTIVLIICLNFLSANYVKANISDSECPQEIKDAQANDDILNEVPCVKVADSEDCPDISTYYTDCEMCCPPGEKPEKKGCMSWKEEVSTGSYCGQIGKAPLRWDTCKASDFCDGNPDSDTYHTCVKKPSVDDFDCENPPTGADALQDGLTNEDFDCKHYIHRGHPMKCKVTDGVGKCTEVPQPGDSCDDDEDVAPFRCENEDMSCIDGKCAYLKDGDKCGDSAEAGFENTECEPASQCTKRGPAASGSSLYAFDEDVDDAEESICIKKLLGGDSCGYPGKGCTGSSYCFGAPNGKEDDARAGLSPFIGTSMKRIVLRCGVFCDGKMAKIDFGLGTSFDGDCVCDDDTRCNFLAEFGAVGANGATAAEDACPSDADTKKALEEDWKGKTGSCAVPGFINNEHKVGDACFTESGSRVCANGGQWSTPDTKCDETETCVNRKLGVTAAFKRIGFLEDFDFGNSCKFNEDDAEEEDDIANDIKCVCGPKGKAVWQKSYAPQDDGTAFWCSAIDVIHSRCMQRNKCKDEQCEPCRKTYEEKVIDCSRPKASGDAYQYYRATYQLGADPNFKNKRFVGAFFGVFFALLFVIGGCCFACKKCRDKKRAAQDEDGNKKSNAVVPKQDV